MCKRVARVPEAARLLGCRVSKADLLEAAVSLAALAEGAADDLELGARGLLRELNAQRAARGVSLLSEERAFTRRALR